MKLECVIFDLDGVIVSTDEQHYLGWKRIADEEGIDFDREINLRQRGVSRMESLEVLLERAQKTYSEQEKIALAERKNGYYKELIKQIRADDVLPGFREFFADLRARGVKCAVGSSSRNTQSILRSIGLSGAFDFVADGTMIQRSKPFPDVFLKAAEGAGANPAACLVVEDADAGVRAGKAAGMKVLAIAAAAGNGEADFSARDLTEVSAETLIAAMEGAKQ